LHSILDIRRSISAFDPVCAGPTSGSAKVILSDCLHNGVLQLTARLAVRSEGSARALQEIYKRRR
jgi:Cdc6-like AAA superfamily ATPase